MYILRVFSMKNWYFSTDILPKNYGIIEKGCVTNPPDSLCSSSPFVKGKNKKSKKPSSCIWEEGAQIWKVNSNQIDWQRFFDLCGLNPSGLFHNKFLDVTAEIDDVDSRRELLGGKHTVFSDSWSDDLAHRIVNRYVELLLRVKSAWLDGDWAVGWVGIHFESSSFTFDFVETDGFPATIGQ